MTALLKTARPDAARVLRHLKREVRTWITQLGASPRLDARSTGHLEALRHVATVIANQARRPPPRRRR